MISIRPITFFVAQNDKFTKVYFIDVKAKLHIKGVLNPNFQSFRLN